MRQPWSTIKCGCLTMIKRRDYERSAKMVDGPPIEHILRTTRNLSVAVEKGHARFAHQLVDELIALRDTERITQVAKR